ncbi:MAG: NAD-dependent deacylase [Deltaproteobacteria bacterium]|nr:NAD-dependent deacylase [Deltaproteobacteria bacterium]
MDTRTKAAAEIVFTSRSTIALTGAGVSVESGIPDFRSAGGLWSKYDPAEYATITAFRQDPERVWKMLNDMDELVGRARPNDAHIGMGDLERMGYLNGIITQNIDNLHQAGGARDVIEYHGNSSTLSCLWCGNRYGAQERRDVNPPRCECGKILKPDVVFFGETIPPDAMNRSFRLAASCQALLVVGTSAVVSPANTIPTIAKQNNAKIIEINKESTHLTGTVTDIFLQGSAGELIRALVEEIKELEATASRNR